MLARNLLGFANGLLAQFVGEMNRGLDQHAYLSVVGALESE
jgi:hypothetical protein